MSGRTTTLARRGLCLVLSAPSGAGKSSLMRALLAAEPELSLSVSVTTRHGPRTVSVFSVVSRGSILAGPPIGAVCGPMKSTPGARIDVPTRSRVVPSFQARAV